MSARGLSRSTPGPDPAGRHVGDPCCSVPSTCTCCRTACLETTTLFGYELSLLRVDALSKVFGYVFHLAAFIGLLFSLHVKDTTQTTAGILYAGSSIGAAFCGDLITLFVFWEMTAITSVFLILANPIAESRAASLRYLVIQVLSGVLLLAGVVARFQETGSLAFEFIGLSGRFGLADLPRLRHQMRLPAAAHLADRRLSEVDPDGRGLPERLHHQARGLHVGRAASRAPTC